MRKFQVSIKVLDLSKVPYEKEHVISVYADANDFYEAAAEAIKNLYEVYQNKKEEVFGATYVSYDEEPFYRK
jgi:hypothetical protein